MSRLPSPQAREIHVVSVISRSGRASREVARVDVDATGLGLAEISSDIADTVYSRTSDAERHAPLAQAVHEALATAERVPGQPAVGKALLPDGRTARVERILSW